MSPKDTKSSKKTVLALTLAVVCASAAVLLIAERKPNLLRPTVTETKTAPEVAAVSVVAVNAVSPTSGQAATTPTPIKKAKPASKAASAAATLSLADTPATIATYVAPSANTPVAETEVKALVQEAPVRAATLVPAVTIAGCLERDGESFRLKDTSGANAPKARSWKSGFLKKGTPRIELIDSANRLKFRDHVGQYVSVTGTLTDREMQAHSLQRVATSCE